MVFMRSRKSPPRTTAPRRNATPKKSSLEDMHRGIVESVQAMSPLPRPRRPDRAMVMRTFTTYSPYEHPLSDD